ncbi:hypothetical protein [Roseospira goensis]|uniref:Lipoprotein n=1 Tax=Roseospira goensis TaxID=391922 RepID=A0A7W6S176_9PROT|nr:hypothetical protein [Roseospira goensis]MBB4286317.1 hypothetical protein [Roseospira goensis]
MAAARAVSAGALAGVLSLALAACAGPRTVSHVSSPNDVFNYVITGTLPLEVVGNPFAGVSDATVAAAAARAMSGNVNGRPLGFVPTAVGTAGPGYRTVLFLGDGGVPDGQALCRGALPAGTGQTGETSPGTGAGTGAGTTAGTGGGGPLHASAALCDRAEMVAWAEGWGGPATAPDSAAFRILMDQLANAVFKRERDRREIGDPWPG